MNDASEWERICAAVVGLPEGRRIVELLEMYRKHGPEVFAPDEALVIKALITIVTGIVRANG